MTDEEYGAMLGLSVPGESDSDTRLLHSEDDHARHLQSMDICHVTNGVMHPVKNQGSCGSCWAFSATETTESTYMIAGNDQVIMAPQELVDCAKGLFSNHG